MMPFTRIVVRSTRECGACALMRPMDMCNRRCIPLPYDPEADELFTDHDFRRLDQAEAWAQVNNHIVATSDHELSERCA